MQHLMYPDLSSLLKFIQAPVLSFQVKPDVFVPV